MVCSSRVQSVRCDSFHLSSSPSLFLTFSPSLRSSRWYLSYHTVDQIVLGWGLGYLFAMVSCLFTEVLPQRMPNSFLGRARRWVVDCWPLRLLEVEDRWDPTRSLDGWSKKEGLAMGTKKVE